MTVFNLPLVTIYLVRLGIWKGKLSGFEIHDATNTWIPLLIFSQWTAFYKGYENIKDRSN